jgi:hypothetical protein
MKLKLADKKVELIQMKVPELIERTYLEYEFELNTQHLHPVLTIAGKEYKKYNTFITLPDISSKEITIKVELFDDNNKVIHIYESILEYNKYQITGTKPIRPDIEAYIFSLEEQIRNLTTAYEARIKELEEKGELV